MAQWRPLSKRDQPDPRLDEPTEGLPPYLAGPVAAWLRDALFDRIAGFRTESLTRLQLRFKLEPPLQSLHDLESRMSGDESFALDVLDYALHHLEDFREPYERPETVATRLAAILATGGSAWEVAPAGGGRFHLSRRAVGPVREVVTALSPSSRAHEHLVAAWNRLTGRNPDPTGAYREAVRAVEAAAKPVVLPANDRATLGTMIAALRDKPDKWTVTLGTVEDVRRTMELVWTNQLDRHGTDDESVPLNVSPEEADVAVHLSIALVRLFVGGHVRVAS